MTSPTKMSFDDAVAAVTRFSALFEGVKIIAAQVKDDDLREQVIREAEARKAAVDQAIDKANAALKGVEASINVANVNLAEAERRAAEVVSIAEAKSKSLLAEAQSKASKLVADAQRDADVALSEASKAAGEKQRQIDALAKEIDRLDQSLEGKRGDLSAIERKISDARALLANFMGAGK